MFFQQLEFYFVLGRDGILWSTEKTNSNGEIFYKVNGEISIAMRVHIDSSLKRRGGDFFFYPPPIPSMKLYCRECWIRVRLESEIIYPYVTFKVFQKKLIIIDVNYSLLPCDLWMMKQKVKRWVVYDFSLDFYWALFESPKPQPLPTLSRSIQITYLI